LVKFALDNGQPIDSALNGVLPIHAACCSNTNVAVVLFLIERGADVNARRLARKFSNEKGVQTVGTTGSTPLHFAAANGCLAVVDILLRHGAIVDMTDKYGSSPLSVAAARNHPDVASLLRQYSAMQRGVQDLTPDGEVKDVFADRRGSGDTHRGTVTPPRSSSGHQKDTRATRAPGQRRISLPSITESPSSPAISAPPRQSCDFDRMPQSTEPLVMSTAFIRSTPSQPTRNIASAQSRSEDRPSKSLIRDQSDWNLETVKDQTRRSMRRSHTTQVTESNVLPKSKGAAVIKRRKSMESAGFLSPRSALSVPRRKSFDQLTSLLKSDLKSRRSSDASTASQGTSSSGTTRTSNTSISDASDLAQEAAVDKGQGVSNKQINSVSKPRLASNMDRSAEKDKNMETRNDSDSDLPGSLFRRRTIQDTPGPKMETAVPRFNSMVPGIEAMTSSSSITEDGLPRHHGSSTVSLHDISAPRHSTGSISSGHSGSGTVNVSSRLSRMWSSSNSSSKENLRDGFISGSSSASNWNASEFGEACGEAAAQNLAGLDSSRARGNRTMDAVIQQQHEDEPQDQQQEQRQLGRDTSFGATSSHLRSRQGHASSLHANSAGTDNGDDDVAQGSSTANRLHAGTLTTTASYTHDKNDRISSSAHMQIPEALVGNSAEPVSRDSSSPSGLTDADNLSQPSALLTSPTTATIISTTTTTTTTTGADVSQSLGLSKDSARQNPTCPVCKAGCAQDKVIPIYGRGKEQVDPRSTTPKRPPGQRPEPLRNTNQAGFTLAAGQVTFTGTMIPPFMFSPFGIQYGGSYTGNIGPNGAVQTPQQAYISRMLFMLGTLILVGILLY
ncbi:hypothetical protein BGX27_001718, partial [Mortierella sp. AM989]